MGERIESDREADQAEDALRAQLAVKEARSRWRRIWHGMLFVMLYFGSLAVFALATRLLGGVR